MRRFSCLILLALIALTQAGCKSSYYGFWEKFGYEKRDIFVERVEDARDAQNGAKEEFKTTLERFQEITGKTGGDLEAKYKKLNGAYEDCKGRADKVSARIKDVETVANDLFAEWGTEIEQISDAKLRSKSAELRSDTMSRYKDLITAMKKSEAKMPPVLQAFNDQVLFLKANLNAAAVSSLQDTAIEIEDDVTKLIAEMDASIKEANEFIESLGK
ncbi:MAG TPA: DUF2959 domain-containing protein [Tepidisphaeraceae bacterium]|nr:DUF2959 domain-containing protein [Tepidisphaeraceae bacterium]